MTTSQASVSTKSHWCSGRLSFAVFALLILLAFGGSLGNDFVDWDDGIYIHHNPLVTDPWNQSVSDRLLTPNLGYPLPLPVFIYGILFAVSSEPWLFHLLNMMVHLFNVSLFFVLLRSEVRNPMLAVAAAIAFAVHPIVVEPVVWAVGLKDLLTVSGGLVAIYGLRNHSGLIILGAAVAYASKPSALLLGFGLLFFLPWAKDSRRIPVVCVAAIGLVQVALTRVSESELLRTTTDEPFSMSRVLGAAGVSLEHLLVPASLTPRYPAEATSITYESAGAVFLVLIVTLWLFWAKRWRNGKTNALGWLSFAVVLYVPVSNVIPLHRFTADSYLYGVWCGLLGAMVWALDTHWAKLAELFERLGAMVKPLAIGIAFAWTALSAAQTQTWKDSESLWEYASTLYPQDPTIMYFYGNGMAKNGKIKETLALYLENTDILKRGKDVPGDLVSWYVFHEDFKQAEFWFHHGFDSGMKQPRELYQVYLRYIVKDYERHSRRDDWHLTIGLNQWLADRWELKMVSGEIGILIRHALRLRLPKVAEEFEKEITSPTRKDDID